MMYSAATGSLYSDVHRGVSSLAFGLWGKRWRPPNGTSEGGPTGGSLRPLVWFYFARWIILPGECRPLQQPTFLTHLDTHITLPLWTGTWNTPSTFFWLQSSHPESAPVQPGNAEKHTHTHQKKTHTKTSTQAMRNQEYYHHSWVESTSSRSIHIPSHLNAQSNLIISSLESFWVRKHT